jgi:hypothetical protein
MLEARVIPHIPIMAYMNFNELTACVVRDQDSLALAQSTTFAGLTSFTIPHYRIL